MQEEPSKAAPKPVAAFVLSLLAGLGVLIPAVLRYAWGPSPMGDGMGSHWMRGGWMWRHSMMRDMAPMLWWPWFGVLAGIVVLIGAIMLYNKPEQCRGWGMAILILSAVNLFIGMGGFLASVLGIIGGAMALAWRPKP